MKKTKQRTTRENADAKKREASAGDAGTPTTSALPSRPTTLSPQCVEFAKSFTRGPCSCYHPMASMSWGMDENGKSTYRHDPGPKKECMRCKARRALEADGIEYDKDDSYPRPFLTL